MLVLLCVEWSLCLCVCVCGKEGARKRGNLLYLHNTLYMHSLIPTGSFELTQYHAVGSLNPISKAIVCLQGSSSVTVLCVTS